MKRTGVQLARFITPHFEDLILQFPDGLKDLTLDKDRVFRMHQTYGDEYLTIHLPDAQKTFERALSRGFAPGYFGSSDRTKWASLSGFSRKPKFMRFFLRRIFDADGKLLDDACPDSVKAVIGTLALFKKVELPCKQEYIQDEVDQFFRIEASLRTPSCDWSGGFFNRCSLSDGSSGSSEPDLFGEDSVSVEKLVRFTQSVADRIISSFGYLDPFTVTGRHGPGAVSDLSRGLDKYVFPGWGRRLESYFPCDHHSFGNASCYEAGPLGIDGQGRDQLADASAKLIAVPKTQKGPRLIASEPTSHMWVQQGILKELESMLPKSLLRHAINFNDQLPSRRRAELASRDARLCTVDLKSASDRLTLWTVERVFRANVTLLQAFAAARTMWVRAPEKVDNQKRYVVLRKFANQGSALTFPVQSIVYAVFCIAATMFVRSMKVTTRNILKVSQEVTVFGDDLILPSTALPYLELLLQFNQLKINAAKTHFTGNFAESCGFRGFRGTDVSPSYLTCVSSEPSPSDISALVEVSNNFAKEWRFHVSNEVASLVPDKWLSRMPVTHLNGGGLSLFTFSPHYSEGTRIAYSKRYQRLEMVLPMVRSKDRIIGERDGTSSLLHFFVGVKPNPHRLSYLDGPTFRKVGAVTEAKQSIRLARVPVL